MGRWTQIVLTCVLAAVCGFGAAAVGMVVFRGQFTGPEGPRGPVGLRGEPARTELTDEMLAKALLALRNQDKAFDKRLVRVEHKFDPGAGLSTILLDDSTCRPTQVVTDITDFGGAAPALVSRGTFCLWRN